ncbi:MAG: acyl-CoA thioesterase [Lentisphaerae bacterium]|nr:MAG: acyl-CoA thioesterase [Lentisphaerota bacterium]
MKRHRKRRFSPPFVRTGAVEENPPPLRFTVRGQRVRFDECDPLGIVWHGRFTSYFEDARVAHGRHYGIGYLDFRRHHVATPIKQLYHEYLVPLKFDEEFSTEAILHWSEAARLNYEFIVRNLAGDVVACGWSVQLMVNPETFETLLVQPAFYRDFCHAWQRGALQNHEATGS